MNKEKVICGEALAKILEDYDSPYHFYRSVYKYGACGAWVGMRIDGEDLYCSDLPNKWEGIAVSQLMVGSIVEGVDFGTTTYKIEIGRLKTLNKRFFKALESVEKEAHDIWMDTHGCETCSKHFEIEEYNKEPARNYFWGTNPVPVWVDCPDCEGHGIIK